MPHIIVKLWPGKTEKQKEEFAAKIAKDGAEIFGVEESWFSVAMEEVNPDDWKDKVYKTEIVTNKKLYKKPGYTM